MNKKKVKGPILVSWIKRSNRGPMEGCQVSNHVFIVFRWNKDDVVVTIHFLLIIAILVIKFFIYLKLFIYIEYNKVHLFFYYELNPLVLNYAY